MTNNKQQTAVELMIAEIQRRVAIIQSEPQTMTRELMIENLGVDLGTYKEMEKEQMKIAFEIYRDLLSHYEDGSAFEDYYNETYGGNNEQQ